MATRLKARIGVDRNAVARAIEVLVDLLDHIDGDPDLEPSGDDLDRSHDEGEPDFAVRNTKTLVPGCSISDPGEYEDGF